MKTADDVACPHCGAPPLSPCARPNGTRHSGAHEQRWKAAQEREPRRVQPRRGAVVIVDGEVYPSMRAAERATGRHRRSLRHMRAPPRFYERESARQLREVALMEGWL